MIDARLVAIEPKSHQLYDQAVAAAGGEVQPLSAAVGGLIWTSYDRAHELVATLQKNPQLTWVQLPWAGVDAFADILTHPVRFTSAKGAYREPVAEHALALALSLARIIPERVRAREWGRKFADSLYDAEVVIVGAGGITEELVRLLAPFRSRITVVRNQNKPFDSVFKVVPLDQLAQVLPSAKFVFLACALTEETRGLFDAEMLQTMAPDAYLINIARGPVVVTEDLLYALNAGIILGAGVDVTDPEPLPTGHPAWDCPNLIITPHSADTATQVLPMFANRIRENVLAYRGLGPWVGQVHSELGY